MRSTAYAFRDASPFVVMVYFSTIYSMRV